MSVTAEMTGASREGERARIAIALALTLLMWASAFVVIRSAGRHLSPGPLALTRIVIGSVALGIAMIARRQRLPGLGAFARAVIAGVLWFGAYMVSLNAAERWVDAGTSSLLVNTGPLFIAALAGWLLHEGFPRALLAGCVVALAGAALIAVSVSGPGFARAAGRGSLCGGRARLRPGDSGAEAGVALGRRAARHLACLHRRRGGAAGVRPAERA